MRADNLGILNPLRYRGYVYDHETELYYLQSRYYNPEWGRFLNADVFVSTGQGILGNNMFAYCGNNPVNSYDPTGYFALRNDMLDPRCMLLGVGSMVKKIIHISDEMDVCTDGSLCNAVADKVNPYGDNSHWNETARLNGICAHCVNYMVIPGDCQRKDELLGCVGVIINNNTGKYVFAVVCEIGPNENGGNYGTSAWDEVSICAAWALNGHQSGANIANSRQYGSYTFIIFLNSKQTWDISGDLQSQIDAVGSQYWP